MQIKSNLDELIQKFQRLADQASSIDWADALLIGVNQGMGEMKFRIFNTGRDISNDSFGVYIGKVSGSVALNKKQFKPFIKNKNQTRYTEYEKKRLGKGRQIIFKDLEFTGALRRGIIVAKDGTKRAIIYIPNEELFKLAGYQEEQIGRIKGTGKIAIFGLSDQEKESTRQATNTALKELYDRILNG